MKSKTLPVLAIFAALTTATFAQQQLNAVSAATAQFGARPQTAVAANFSEPAQPAAVASAERQAFDLINAQRAEKGLPALVWNDEVAEVARHHSQNMAKGDFFSHQDLDGLLVDDRAERAGLTNWSAIGENIAFVKGFADPCQIAINNWMHSNAHRENLLNDRWKESAIGVAITPDGKYYFTQVFIVRK